MKALLCVLRRGGTYAYRPVNLPSDLTGMFPGSQRGGPPEHPNWRLASKVWQERIDVAQRGDQISGKPNQCATNTAQEDQQTEPGARTSPY
jgi:hypothetical protein